MQTTPYLPGSPARRSLPSLCLLATASRDVVGAHEAGLGMLSHLTKTATPDGQPCPCGVTHIHDIRGLLAALASAAKRQMPHQAKLPLVYPLNPQPGIRIWIMLMPFGMEGNSALHV